MPRHQVGRLIGCHGLKDVDPAFAVGLGANPQHAFNIYDVAAEHNAFLWQPNKAVPRGMGRAGMMYLHDHATEL